MFGTKPPLAARHKWCASTANTSARPVLLELQRQLRLPSAVSGAGAWRRAKAADMPAYLGRCRRRLLFNHMAPWPALLLRALRDGLCGGPAPPPLPTPQRRPGKPGAVHEEPPEDVPPAPRCGLPWGTIAVISVYLAWAILCWFVLGAPAPVTLGPAPFPPSTATPRAPLCEA